MTPNGVDFSFFPPFLMFPDSNSCMTNVCSSDEGLR